tara:strand:- start:3773 stop:4903 length:1131 start_codon:yes stop_codon:yes gene_type:complete
MQKEFVEDIIYKKLTLNNLENNIIKNMDQNNLSESYNLIEILNKILENNSYNNIAKYLNIAVGTVKRWIELNNVPKQYTFDLFKLANINIDYSKFSYKEKDQFFTPADTSKYCYQKFIEIIKEKGDDKNNYVYVEPSAGNGVFLKLLPEDRRIGLDIEPKFDEILEQDFLDWQPSEDKKYIVIGNPPFGLRGQLALKFINHAGEFADYVCFILPQLFESDGKGVPRKRVIGLNLIYSEKLDSKFELPDGKNINVECIFQIWSKFHKDKKYDIVEENNTKIKIYSLSDGGTPSTTRNKKMFYLCDAYLPSTCFGKDNMKYYDSFDALPGRKGYGVVFNKDKEENLKKFKNITWSDVAFLSTNSAYNLRSSQITNQFK